MSRLQRSKVTFFVIALIVALLAYITFASPTITIANKAITFKGVSHMRYGIDIRGGVEAIFRPSDKSITPTSDQLDSARRIIEQRLDSQNIYDRTVTVEPETGSIVVRFPWKSDDTDFNPQKAITELGETARLTFRDPDGNVIVDGKNVVSSVPSYDQQTLTYVVELEFDSEGAQAFSEATGRLVGQNIGIYMDENLIRNPVVQTQITDGRALITGMTDREDAKQLADKIRAGALPFSLVSENHSIITPTLGSGALDVMVKAGFLAFILVCLFILLYYRLPGFVACIALTLQAVGQLLALSMPQFTLTLPGIAAVILSIGMGVDANIIVSERIKEELNSGKPLNTAISSGFHRAFSSVFDGNVTVIIVAVILWIFGSGAMDSFAYSLLTGVALNFLAGVTASRLMISSLSRFSFLRNPALYGARRAAK